MYLRLGKKQLGVIHLCGTHIVIHKLTINEHGKYPVTGCAAENVWLIRPAVSKLSFLEIQ
jgi:hypothetical protein